MLAGLTLRPAATEFAFLVGIPTMFAATGYELLKVRGHGAGEEARRAERGVPVGRGQVDHRAG